MAVYDRKKCSHVLKVFIFILKTKQQGNSCSMTTTSSQTIHKSHMQGKGKNKPKTKNCES